MFTEHIYVIWKILRFIFVSVLRKQVFLDTLAKVNYFWFTKAILLDESKLYYEQHMLIGFSRSQISADRVHKSSVKSTIHKAKREMVYSYSLAFATYDPLGEDVFSIIEQMLHVLGHILSNCFGLFWFDSWPILRSFMSAISLYLGRLKYVTHRALLNIAILPSPSCL